MKKAVALAISRRPRLSPSAEVLALLYVLVPHRYEWCTRTGRDNTAITSVSIQYSLILVQMIQKSTVGT